jgi:hypothetical protein
MTLETYLEKKFGDKYLRYKARVAATTENRNNNLGFRVGSTLTAAAALVLAHSS